MKRRSFVSAALAAGATPSLWAQAPKESTEGLDLQAARAKMMSARGQRVAYTKKFDLQGIPEYKPRRKVSGAVRVWGSNYIVDGNVGRYWEEIFRAHHPDARIDWHMKTTSAAVPSLVFGVSDLGMGRKLTFQEQQLFERYFDRSPLEVDIATGSYNVPGWNPGFGVIVHKDNPLTEISMDQLDGIFGAERSGGWEGTSWRPNWARGPEKNIRSWGQMGLTGEWKDKPINVYGLTPRYHQAVEISDRILAGSDKWNERLKAYANFVSAKGSLERGMNEDLAADRYGIGIVAAPTTNLSGGAAQATQKLLPLAPKTGAKAVPYTLETVQDRSYPFYDAIYAYFDREPGRPMKPGTEELVRLIISREGQDAVMRDGKYLPLTAQVALEQSERLGKAAG